MGGGGDEDEVVVRARQLPWRERMRHVIELEGAAGSPPRPRRRLPYDRRPRRPPSPRVRSTFQDTGGRPITIEKAKTIFLMFIDLHAVDIFLDSMENAVKKKVQTVVIISVELLQQALQQFGSDVVSAERIMKVLPELLESSDNHVRKASEVLAVELSRWIGRKALRRSVMKKIAERRKGNISELLLDVQQMTKPKPTRMLRSRQESTTGGELFREKSVGNTFQNAANALYSDAGANNSACESRDATDKFVDDPTIETASTSEELNQLSL